MERPTLLSRKAVRQKYHKVSEATWDYLFDMEKQNRLIDCRAPEPGRLVSYDRAKLERWLVEKGYYTEHDFVGPAAIDTLLRLPFRQHLMVG